MPQTTPTTWKSYKSQYGNLSQQSGAATQSEVYLQSSVAAITQRIRGTWVQPPVTNEAGGNSYVTSDARGAPAAYPGHGTGGPALQGTEPGNVSPYGTVPGQQYRPYIRTPPSMVNKQAYGGLAFQNGRLIAYDRHIAGYTGHTTSSANEQATGGTPNPEKDGRPRKTFRMLNRVLSWQIGVDDTRQLDNNAYHAAVLAGDKPFPLGTQGDRRSIVRGGTPGLTAFRPYGTRGGFGPGAPTPWVYATPGGPYRFGTLLQTGAPQDGPQWVFPGEPHGLHSSTIQPLWISNLNQKQRLPQTRTLFRNRPQNSKAAGQSYGQSAVHLDGSQSVKIQKLPRTALAGITDRFMNSGS
jgi:hypothetical protein